MNAIAVIPARYESTRFPGKPLANILGKPMIQWVYESVSQARNINQVYVATDDYRISDSVKSFGGKTIMTGDCKCGTDRVYEAVKNMDCDVIINVQGDEPLIRARDIERIVDLFSRKQNIEMVTLISQMKDDKEIDDPNNVKVVLDIEGNALFFSRSRIPYKGRCDGSVLYYKHIGIYGYTKDFLTKYISMPESPNERVEKLEQMRALDNGYKIMTLTTDYESIGVDSPDDIKRAESAIKKIQNI